MQRFHKSYNNGIQFPLWFSYQNCSSATALTIFFFKTTWWHLDCDFITYTLPPPFTPAAPPSPLPSPRLLHPHSSPPPTTSRTGATIVCMLFWYFAPRLVSGSGDIKITKDGNVLLNEMVNYYLIIFNDDNYIYYFFNFIL